MYTLYMTYHNKEYPLFTYVPKLRPPQLDPLPWKSTDPVCVFTRYNRFEFDGEFMDWVASKFFPYESYIDHTDQLDINPGTITPKLPVRQPSTLFGMTPTESHTTIVPQKLQFKKTRLF